MICRPAHTARFGALVLGLALAGVGCKDRGPDRAPRRPLIRLGYSSLTPLHTALGLVLERTDLLARRGLRGQFLRVKRGKDQHKAAAAGKLDATFSCEVAAMVHLERLPTMTLTGSPGELGEMALVVPKNSTRTATKQLAGAKVGIQGGASAQMMADRWLASLNQRTQVTTELLRGHPNNGATRLLSGELDAAVLWDPWLTLFVQRHGLRIIERAPFWSVVALFDLKPDDPRLAPYHAALTDALAYVAADPKKVAGWVAEVSPFPVTVIAAVINKNTYISNKLNKPSLSAGPPLRRRLAACERQAHALGAVSEGFTLHPRLRGELSRP